MLMGELVRVCAVADVPEGEARRFAVEGREVAVIEPRRRRVPRASTPICSHEHYFLDEGEVDAEDETIECPKHGSTFDLNTGKPLELPATMPVAELPGEVTEDDVLDRGVRTR